MTEVLLLGQDQGDAVNEGEVERPHGWDETAASKQ